MKRWLTIGLLSAICGAAPSVSAQQPGPTALEKTTALERFQHGVALLDKAEFRHDAVLYEAALVDLQQAYALWPTDKILWNKALCELELKRYLEALKDFKIYDQHLNVSATPSLPHHAELKKYFAEINAATGHVTIQAAAGALVQIDGARVSSAALADVIDILPGNHRFEADTHRVDLVVAAGTSVVVRLVDDPPVATSAIPPKISAENATSAPPIVEHESFWTTGHVVGVAALGISAASFAAAIAFGQKANSASDRVDSLAAQSGPSSCTQNPAGDSCQARSSAHDDQAQAHTASVVFRWIGAAGLITAAGAFILPPLFRNSHSEKTVSVLPTFSPTGGGLSLRGGF